ncbi:MAG: 30S ribosomal protein S2 [Candidatus Spechtbacterales bacterium]
MEDEKMPQQANVSVAVPSTALVDIDPAIKEMLENVLHFGRRKSRQHPKMKPYIFGIRNNVSIIDLEQTKTKLNEALGYLTGVVLDGKIILFVDTRPSTREETRKVAEELGMPYVVERWSGGTITNWKTISSRVEYLKGLEAKMKSEEWDKYTKKERYDMEEEARKLNIFWGGVKGMGNLPDAIFVVDMKENYLAIKEARMKGIKVVAIAETNVNPEDADYPIPANGDALCSVKYILNKIKGAIAEGKSKK